MHHGRPCLLAAQFADHINAARHAACLQMPLHALLLSIAFGLGLPIICLAGDLCSMFYQA